MQAVTRPGRGASFIGTGALWLAMGALISAGSDAPRLPSPTPALSTRVLPVSFRVPSDVGSCRSQLHVDCYGPAQLRRAYDTDTLLTRGIDGRGIGIALVEAFGSPTIGTDLHHFDEAFGIADPPALSVIHPVGDEPRFDPANPVMVAWAEETSLDVEWAHVMAPGARLLVVETSPSEAAGIADYPDVLRAENDVVDHGLADVISQSFGDAESTFLTRSAVLGLRSAFVNAARRGVTVVAAAGDRGAAGRRADGSCCVLSGGVWPSSDPLVTAVGGTMLRLGPEGDRIAADRVWNDSHGAGGGGLSQVFDRPAFQDGVEAEVGVRRGTPDLSLSSGVDDGAVLFYYSFTSPVSPGGWHLGGGTSEATPLFAGIVALADETAGHRLGLLNERLYRLASSPAITDVVDGDNGMSVCAMPCGPDDAAVARLDGYPARPGYDLASGVGTVDAARLVAALAGR